MFQTYNFNAKLYNGMIIVKKTPPVFGLVVFLILFRSALAIKLLLHRFRFNNLNFEYTSKTVVVTLLWRKNEN